MIAGSVGCTPLLSPWARTQTAISVPEENGLGSNLEDYSLHKHTMLQPTTLLAYDSASATWSSHDSVFVGQVGSTCNFPTFRIGTWNLWEDDRHTHLRHPFILDTLFSACAPCAVIALQEVTSSLFMLLLAHPQARGHWMVTDLEEQFCLCQNYYSTVILVHRHLAPLFKVSTAFLEYENSRMSRSLNVVEFSFGAEPILRVGTSHFESHFEDVRKRCEQFKTAAHVLTAPGHMLSDEFSLQNEEFLSSAHCVPAILAGDCNIQSYAEFAPLFSAPYSFQDSFLVARPTPESPFRAHPTFNITVNNRQGIFKSGPPKRLDYIFVSGQGLAVRHGDDEAGFMGEDPVCEKDVAIDMEGKDQCVWPSDHLGIWVNLQFIVGVVPR